MLADDTSIKISVGTRMWMLGSQCGSSKEKKKRGKECLRGQISEFISL